MEANPEKTTLGFGNTFQGFRETMQGFEKTILGFENTFQGFRETLHGSENTLLPFEKTRRVFRGFWLGLGRTFLGFGSLAWDIAAMRLGSGEPTSSPESPLQPFPGRPGGSSDAKPDVLNR
jgi:hypothetical protein